MKIPTARTIAILLVLATILWRKFTIGLGDHGTETELRESEIYVAERSHLAPGH